MNEQLRAKINQKINEVTDKSDEISKLTNALDELRINQNAFGYGIIIGRLYNSFYYQCRRILKRNPTSDEFNEFLDILNSKQREILDLLKSN